MLLAFLPTSFCKYNLVYNINQIKKLFFNRILSLLSDCIVRLWLNVLYIPPNILYAPPAVCNVRPSIFVAPPSV